MPAHKFCAYWVWEALRLMEWPEWRLGFDQGASLYVCQTTNIGRRGRYSPSNTLYIAGEDRTADSALMTEWHVVQRSRANLTCSAVIPSFFLDGLLFGDGKGHLVTISSSASGVVHRERGSTKARPRSRTIASTNASLFFLSGWNKGHDASASVESETHARSLAARTL